MEVGTDSRRYEVDWLRVIAFFILVFFHVAVLFLPDGVPSISNRDSSPLLGLVASFFHQFRLSLLFLIAGIGVGFSIKYKGGSAYFKERSQRLLIPLLFGFTVLVPPMIYYEKLYNGLFAGSFWHFYPKFYTDGVYPAGNLSWHHFWFIAYLYIMCVMSWPVFQYLKQQGKAVLDSVTAALSSRFGLYLVVVPLIAIEILLRPQFPGVRDLLQDWASFTHWWLIFLIGFCIANHVSLLDRCKDLRLFSLGVGIISASLLYVLFYDMDGYRFQLEYDLSGDNAVRFTIFSVLRMCMVWAWVLTLVGFAVHYLNRPSRLLHYLNGATYPLYCLHLTITVILAYYIMPTQLNVAVKLITITLGTYLLVFMLYELCIRRVAWLRPLFGGK